MTFESWIMLSFITAIASWFRAVIGMGFALMVLPAYLILLPGPVPATVILVGLSISVLTFWRERRSLDLKGLPFSLGGRFVGNFVAMLFFSFLVGPSFDYIAGISVLIAVALSLLPYSFSPTPARLSIAGVASGVMGTLTSLDGPPIALLYQHQKGEVIRSTLAAYFAIGTILSLAVLALGGLCTMQNVKHSLYLLPSALLGFYASRFTIHRVPKSLLRASILAVSATSAILILAKAAI